MKVVAVVLLVCGAVEVLARAADRRLPVHLHWHDLLTTGKWQQLRSLRREAPVEVVLAGSSQMLTAIDPTRMPVRSYNAGLYRGVPTVTAQWLADEVLPAARPRTVVWGLSVLDLNDNGDFHHGISERYGVAPARARGLSRMIALARLHSAAVRRAGLLVRPRRLARVLLHGDPRRKPMSSVLGPMGKGVEYEQHRNYQLSDHKRAFIQNEIVNDLSMGGSQLEAVRRGAAAVRACGARLVLLEMPFTQEFVDLYPHGAADVSAARELLRQTAEQVGARWLPLSDRELPREWFTDCVHLNGSGMAAWTPAVAELLELSERQVACAS